MAKHKIVFSQNIDNNLLEVLEKEIGFDHELQPDSLTIDTDELSDFLTDAVRILHKNKVNFPTEKHTFKVLGYSCASCANSAETVLKYVDGVYFSSANYANHSVTIAYLPEMTGTEDFKKSLKEIGFDLVSDNNFEKANLEKSIIQKRELIASAFFAIPLFVVGMFFMEWHFGQYLMWFLSTPLVFYFGRHFFVNAWNKAKRFESNMDTLVALSTGTAYVFSVFNLFFPHVFHQHEHAQIYFESAGIVVFFVLLGKYLEDSAKNRASDSIKKLMQMDEQTVKVLMGKEIQDTPIDEVRFGERVRVLPGQKIPLDGMVIDGNSSVSESMISGEPLPKSKKSGDYVFAGTLNIEGVIDFEVKKTHQETYLAGIINKVEEALSSKAPIQKKVDRVSSVFVPVVIAVAVLSFVLWYFVLNDTNMAFLSFVTVLVVACPCAMGLATPTALMAGIGRGAANGILIKNAESLERAGKITDIVLDKTGTITSGKPTVLNVRWLDKTKASVLKSLEMNSTHPLATAIVRNLDGEESINISDVENFPGKGMKGIYKDKAYFAGNKTFMTENGVSDQDLLEVLSINSVVYFASENRILGVFEIGDELKPQVSSHLKEFNEKGIEVHLLSGDNNSAVETMANSLGIRSFRGNVLPEEKAQYISEQKADNKIVAMVGDGVNDTLAFTVADVSIAMSDGADAAKEVADVTILGDNLSRVISAIQLSKNTSKIINQNLFWAFIYNVLAIPVAAGVLYSSTGFMMQPMLASAAMALSSISVVSNSLRLKIIKI
ncbi:MAG TPA: heavy metal translocating P-type ATPase [Leadbetterella sp.]|nr:heavy metal translocating P-type ATPase [Leadbetterella sp.]